MGRDVIAFMDDISADSFRLDVTVVMPAGSGYARSGHTDQADVWPARPTARSMCAIAQCIGALDEPSDLTWLTIIEADHQLELGGNNGECSSPKPSASVRHMLRPTIGRPTQYALVRDLSPGWLPEANSRPGGP